MMDNEQPETKNSADKSLALWAAKKFRLFLIIEMSENSGGSTSCVIDELSPDVLRLSWLSETEVRRGELIISLKGASRTIAGMDTKPLCGSDYIDPHEPFVCITLPNNDRFWLVMMRPSEVDDA
jgi:hypothetical protein